MTPYSHCPICIFVAPLITGGGTYILNDRLYPVPFHDPQSHCPICMVIAPLITHESTYMLNDRLYLVPIHGPY